MRYLIHNNQKNELSARAIYLYDAFHLYLLPRFSEGEFTVSTPIGYVDMDILFITGHTNSVENYLQNYINKIPEKKIVITSCMGNEFKRFSKKKTIYVPAGTNTFCQIRSGEIYGYYFDISDAELDFLNSPGNINDKIHRAYQKL